MTKYAQLRRRAANLLEKKGWTQGAMVRGAGDSYCLIGALRAAAGQNPEDGSNEPIFGALKAMGFKFTKTELADYGEELDDDFLVEKAIDWNDASRRRRHEVLARLRKGL